jgi:hypothetical protein
MDSLPQDRAKVSGVNGVPAGASAASTPPQSPAHDNQKSWGDKYKRGTLHFIRDILFNYIINFGTSALFTYAVVETNNPLNRKFNQFIDAAKSNVGKQVVEFFTRTQLLLCGGHIILPFMKYMHDNKNGLEFGIGHKLDRLQEMVGRGNAASKRNLAEYKYINDLMKSKPRELSDDDKALLAKHCIGDNLQFDEHRESWKHLIKARATGVAMTTTLGILFGLTGKFPEKYQMKTIQEKAGQFLSNKGLNKIPRKIIARPEELGKYVFLELIYTAASKLGFDHMEKRLLKKQELAEAEAAKSELKADKESLPADDIHANEAAGGRGPVSPTAARTTPVLEARRKILESKEQGFLARESAKPAEPGMALS